MFIHKMSYDVRKRLIDVLDAGDFWRELGGRRLNYTYEELNRFRQVGTKLPSPSTKNLKALYHCISLNTTGPCFDVLVLI